ncbi:MAG: glycosyltransferase [Acidimicrobiia bacterium]
MPADHPRRHIAVVTADTLSAHMAGPAIRAWNIAAALSAENDVRLVTTGRAEISNPRFEVSAGDDGDLRKLERWCDVLVFQGWVLAGRPFLSYSDKVLVADVYDPMHLEQLEQARDEGDSARRTAVFRTTAVLNEQLRRADYIACASLKQRDFWLGHLAALGRINPVTYDLDESLSALIGIVPFGIPETPPVATGPAIRGVLGGIGPDDHVIVWGGGIYNWFDPLTLIHAVDRLRRDLPTVRLVFMGLRHPNPEIPTMRMAVAAQALADDLGLTGTHVFFNPGWVPFDQRQDYLLEADVGVSCHLAHLETEFSFRTRILDYLWCGLPIVATTGDSFADIVDEKGIGLTVPPTDADELRGALRRVLDDEAFGKECRANVAALAPEFHWSRVLAPLVEFCRDPHRAPDLLDPEQVALLPGIPVGVARDKGLAHDARLALRYLREGGPRLLATRMYSRGRRLAGFPRTDQDDARPGEH